MSAAVVLEVLQASVGIIKLLQSMQLDVGRVVELQKKATAEHRELSQEELQSLADSAQAAIDSLRD
ncbi:hypothetical protein DRQ53_08075 [bacterium]|nr:MAG: hypothetical protein DRQ53_08075 [bacterium]